MTAKLFTSLFTVAAMASAASHHDMLVSTDWLAQHATDAKVVILHVAANRAIYDNGHIPGARFLPLGEIAVTVNGIHNELPPVADLKTLLEAAGVSDDSRVIVYSDASVLPATRTYFTLDYLGHGDNAALLDGGLDKWRSEGRPLTKDAPAVAQGRFTPHPRPELVVRMDAVKQMSAGALSEVLLDVRPAADFKGEKGSHIPGALNAFWMDNQASRTDQTLKPEDALRQQFEALGLTPAKRVVTYCNSGMQATEAYFTLKYLGYDVRLYDGSMGEWTSKGAPVEK